MSNRILNYLKKNIETYISESEENLTTFCKNNKVNYVTLKKVFEGSRTINIRTADNLLQYIDNKKKLKRIGEE
jgi:molybdopterin-guanine dinucleotide biosynthesis protein A